VKVINQDASKDKTYQPAFLKLIKKPSVDGTIKPGNAASAFISSQSENGSPNTVEELNEILQALEVNMEKEISQIKQRFDQKRLPIIEAIRSKKGVVV
jgi:aryl-alcohol dehydrogenase-like predicted oxidoreductase